MDSQNKNPKILFYAGNGYSFKSWPIWQFYESCQKYPTILVSEELNEDTKRILLNKDFFPTLEKIIIVKKSSDVTTKELIQKNKFYHKEAKRIINEVKPDIAVTIGKNVYTFCLYLRRFAKKSGAKNICILYPQEFPTKEITLIKKLQAICALKPKKSTQLLQKLVIHLKKTGTHLLYYWFLPVLVGEVPFLKEPGMGFFEKFSELLNYYVVFSRKDFDTCSSEGLDKNKLLILKNPYPEGFKKVNETLVRNFVGQHANMVKSPKKKVVWMYPNARVGFKKDGLQIILSQEILETRKQVLALLAQKMKDWEVVIKTHPHIAPSYFEELKKDFASFENVSFANPKDWAEGYVYVCDMILGSPPRSLTLYTAQKMYPEKILVSLDFHKELLGDTYKDTQGVEYISSKEGFEALLDKINDGSYRKTQKDVIESNAREYELKEYSNFINLLEACKR